MDIEKIERIGDWYQAKIIERSKNYIDYAGHCALHGLKRYSPERFARLWGKIHDKKKGGRRNDN